MSSMNTWILSMTVLLISAGVVSIAIGLKLSLPIATNGIPAVWSVILLWLKPPYLYILINGIIISIAASSRFHHTQSDPPSVRSDNLIPVKTPPSDFVLLSSQPQITPAVEEINPAAIVAYENEDNVLELKPVIVNGEEFEDESEPEDVFIDLASTYSTKPQEIVFAEDEDEAEAEDVFIDSTSTYNIPAPEDIAFPELQLASVFPMRGKPPVSSRFGHRKPSPEVTGMKTLRRVTRPKSQETLESTWKMITEGRHVPLTSHLKKFDTWEHHVRHVTRAVDLVPKSETFKERSNYESNSARIRKEPSLSQDELNRRVEAFIKKFNEEMRLQRQESLNQYMEMINRGV